MPIYEWICHDCKILWERECALGKAPSRTRCPECKKLSERNFDNINVSWGDDTDFHTHRQRIKKVNEKGWDKTAADRFLNREVKNTKDRLNDSSFRYKEANINWGKMAEDGLVKEVQGEERNKIIENRKKLTGEAYDRANNLGYRHYTGDALDPRVTPANKQR